MFNAIKKWFATRGLKQIVPSAIRGGLKVLAGWLGALGFEQAMQLETASESIEAFGTALAIFAFAQLWSWWDKPKNG